MTKETCMRALEACKAELPDGYFAIVISGPIQEIADDNGKFTASILASIPSLAVRDLIIRFGEAFDKGDFTEI
jgi:hypothetical protein